MLRLMLIVIILSTLPASIATKAQNDAGSVAPEPNRPVQGHLLDRDHLTSTGQTVPHPGLPQSSGETPLDRSIEQQNDRIDNSICSAC